MRPVQQCTWNWQSRSAAEAKSGSAGGSLIGRALLQSGLMLAVGLLLFFAVGHQKTGLLVIGLAGVVLLLGLFIPAAYGRVHAFGKLLGTVVGQILLYLLMVPFFFLFMTPVALFLRLIKRDPLQRKFRDSQWTYWIPRPPRSRDENVDKQFLRECREARFALRNVGAVGWTQEGDSK